MDTPLGIITNPHAGKNKFKQNSRDLQKIIKRFGTVKGSRSLEQLRSIVEEFIYHKTPYVVCDGGDGTVHWVINTYLDVINSSDISVIESQMPVFIPTNGGTIDFLAQKIGTAGGTAKILKKMHELFEKNALPEVASLSSFLAEGQYTTEHKNKSYRKLGFAGALLGFTQKFFSKYYEHTNPSAQTIIEVISKTFTSNVVKNSFFAGMVPQDMTNYAGDIFDPIDVKVKIDDQPVPFEKINTLNVGSIHINLKGLVKLFARADESDKLHMHVGHLEPFEVFGNLGNLFMGNDYVGKNLIQTTANKLEIISEISDGLSPVLDGEIYSGIATMKVTRGPKLRFWGIKAN